MNDAEGASRVHVVVVGAGIAGLAAAHDLHRAGLSVTVLEAQSWPGGRMTTQPLPAGGRMERGAQFLTTAYRTLPRLIRESGLEASVRPVTERTLLVTPEGRRAVNPTSPVSLLRSGVLGAGDVLGALRAQRRLGALARALPPDDLGAWADLDDVTGGQWAEQNLPKSLHERLLKPAVHGFYFQTLAENSGALLAAVASMSSRPGHVVTLDGGLGALTAALAGPLHVRYGTAVDTVRVTADGARVDTSAHGSVHADAVILAAPGAAALSILADATDLERKLMATSYSPGLLVGVTLERALHAVECAGAYGVLIAPDDGEGLAAIAIGSRTDQRPARREQSEVVTAMLAAPAAGRLRNASDQEVTSETIEMLGRHLPGLGTRVKGSHVVHWDQAMPHTPVGRAHDVARYRSELAVNARVVLAGDYLGFPWTDSAAFNGVWAARHVLASLRPGSAL
ncbi:MAG: FAD-dependent oxidoreductase [Ilumatobacteraceae bacterium]